MPQRDTSKDAKGLKIWLINRFNQSTLFLFLFKHWPEFGRLVNKWAITRAIDKIPPRPHPLVCGWDYTTWEGLTNRGWSGRHLPPKKAPDDLPSPHTVAQTLFAREGEMIESRKSTLLFPYFAQWFTDGFLVADQVDRRRNLSNHDIDLSQLYGLNPETTALIRTFEGGRLKSQLINQGEFPPYLYDGKVPDDELWRIKPEFRQQRRTYEDYVNLGEQFLQVTPPANTAGHPYAEGDKVQLDQRMFPLAFPPYSPEQPPHLSFNELTLTGSAQRFARHHEHWFAMANDRANSTPAFVMLNVLMLREHNRIAALLEHQYKGDRNWNQSKAYFDERIFQTTRNILTVIVIKIVLEEYINHISPYAFDLFVDPPRFFKPMPWKWTNWMTVEFNILYRWHSMIPDNLTVGGETLPSIDTLWNTQLIINRGLAPMFNDTSKQVAGRIGAKNTWDFLVHMAEAPTVQMGRDAEIATYNDYRALCGMQRVDAFNQVTGDSTIQSALQELYGTPDRIEFFTGLLAEDVRPNAALGPLAGTLVAADAFSQALTNPLLHKRTFTPKTFSEVGWNILQEKQTLEALVKRNTVNDYDGDYHIQMTRRDWQRE